MTRAYGNGVATVSTPYHSFHHFSWKECKDSGWEGDTACCTSSHGQGRVWEDRMVATSNIPL